MTHKAKCDTCDYREDFFDPLRSYEMSDGSTVTIERTFVWCGACRGVRWGEELADLAELERKLAAIEAKEPSAMDELSVFLDRHTSLEKVTATHTTQLRGRISWRRSRRSAPRCLECGSAGIVSLPQSETRSGFDKWTLKEHPGCGGVVTVIEQAVLTLDRRWIRYSPEGEKRQAFQMSPSKGAVPIKER